MRMSECTLWTLSLVPKQWASSLIVYCSLVSVSNLCTTSISWQWIPKNCLPVKYFDHPRPCVSMSTRPCVVMKPSMSWLCSLIRKRKLGNCKFASFFAWLNLTPCLAARTRRAMRGGVSFREALHKRLMLIQPTVEMISQYLEHHPPRFTKGIK